jgi:uncharacterized protein (DUF111 family)
MRLQRIHLEPVGGVAGDMLLAALCDLGADTRKIERAFASLETPGLVLSTRRRRVNGERALSVRSVPGSSDHEHRHLEEVLRVIDRAEVSPAAKRLARRVFRALAAAEGRVHGHDAHHVHLHEVGQLDSILDVLGIAVALDSLGWPRVTSAPLPVGSGTVKTRHGLLRCPVPVVRDLARRHHVPLVRVPVDGETVTPTGIAVVAEVCRAYVSRPRGESARVGVGAGTRRFADRPNVIRVYGFAARR